LLSQFNALPPELWGPAPQYFANVRGFLYVMLHARLSTLNLAALTFALSSALMLLVVVALRRRESLALGFALVIVVTLLTSYHAYLHDMSLLLPAFFLTGSYLRGRKLGRIELTLALVVYALFLTPIMCMVFRLGHIPIFLGMLLLAGVQFAALLDRPRKGRTELPSGPVSNSLAQF
jgi:hypothetical protein